MSKIIDTAEVQSLIDRLLRWADSGDMGRAPDPADLRRVTAASLGALLADRLAAEQHMREQCARVIETKFGHLAWSQDQADAIRDIPTKGTR